MLAIFLSAISSTACSKMSNPFAKKDRTPHAEAEAPFDPPNTYQEWAYDAPSYVKPPQELTPEPKVKSGDPLHYFTKEKVVMIRRPEGYTPEEMPRVAIWWTDNNGFHWNKAGYFGREQSFFPFEVEDDGDYGIRFVGPGQEPALHSLPLPERVYHVDTTLPEVTVAIEPEQTWYHVGDKVTISWKAADYHLNEYPVRVGMLTDFTGDDQQAVELQRDLADEDSVTYTLRKDTLDHEIRFRVDALDRAANLGTAISFALQVVADTPAEELSDDHQTGEQMTDSGEEPPASKDTGVGVLREPSMMDETAHSSAIKPRANTPSTLIEPTAPFATAAARPTHHVPDGVDSKTPISAGDAPGMAEPTGGAFTLPASLTRVPGTHVQPTEVATAPTANPDGASPGQRNDMRSVRPLDAAPTNTLSEQFSGPAHEPTASLIPKGDLFANLASPSRPCDLLVPMPATVEKPERVAEVATAHPWRVLSGNWPTIIQTVWNLPRPNFGAELNRLFDIGMLADGALSHPVAEPPSSDHVFAGLPEDAPGTVVP